MEQMMIRPAAVEDVETLLEFEQRVIEAERPFDPTLKADLIHYYDLNEMIHSDSVHLLVAEMNGLLVGSGYARIEQAKMFHKHPSYAYLGFMYVRPDYRGKGINKQIIDALKNWSSSKNVNELRLEVYHDNLPAVSAYKKVGFSTYLSQMRLAL